MLPKCLIFIIYADDTTLSTIAEMVVRFTTDLTISEIINNELSMVNNWLKVNRLSLNIKKSKYMIFQSLTLKSTMLILNRLLNLIFSD